MRYNWHKSYDFEEHHRWALHTATVSKPHQSSLQVVCVAAFKGLPFDISEYKIFIYSLFYTEYNTFIYSPDKKKEMFISGREKNQLFLFISREL